MENPTSVKITFGTPEQAQKFYEATQTNQDFIAELLAASVASQIQATEKTDTDYLIAIT